MLIGREAQLAQIDALLDAACAQSAGALRLVGGPGLGKTSLLASAATGATARGMHVVRLVALELEQDLHAAGLDLLLRHLGHPEAPATPAGLLASLSSASADRPLLLTIDDIQWLDEATLTAISFATRRLLADPIAVMLAGRPEIDRTPALKPIRRVEVPPLTADQGMVMLRSIAPSIPRSTAQAVVEALGGVPLALRDVDRLLPPEVLSGRAPLPAPLPVSAAVQDRYAQGFQDLAALVQQAVVTLACEGAGDPDVVQGALAHLGIDRTGLEAAEESGLIRLLPEPTFVHPLARAAVHSAARPRDVRRAHEALARTLEDRGSTAAALPHRAAGTIPPDDALSDELAGLAQRLSQEPATRSEAAAVALSAARFATDPRRRVELLLLAARCSDAEQALAIVRDLERGTLSAEQRAACTFLRLENDITLDPRAGLALLAELQGQSLSPRVAAEAEVWRVWSAADCLDLAALEQVATRISLAAEESEDWVLLAAGGFGFTFLAEHGRAVPLLRRACELSRAVDPSVLAANQLTDWAIIPGWLGEDDEEHASRFRAMNQLLRDTGLPEKVVAAAFFSAERARREGAWGRAEALYREAIDVSATCGVADETAMSRLACMLAYRGDTTATRDLLDACREGLRARSPWIGHWIEAGEGALALTTGQPDRAAAVLRPLRDLPFVGRGARDAVACGLVDLVECLVPLGKLDEATAVAAHVAGRLDGVVDPFGPAMVARCRAIVDAEQADALFDEALTWLARTTEVFETARTQLLLGEHLRRTRRPRQAREPLSRALRVFEQLRAGPWAERARRELAASGERVVPQQVGPVVELTPQEARVALAVAEGLTNTEVAQRLFLSVKTVEFHLGRVYRKLDVRSRGGLAKALAAQGL